MHSEQRPIALPSALHVRGAVAVTIRRGAQPSLTIHAASAKVAAEVMTQQLRGMLEIDCKGRGDTVITTGGASVVVAGSDNTVIVQHGDGSRAAGRSFRTTIIQHGAHSRVAAGDYYEGGDAGAAGHASVEAPRVEITLPSVPALHVEGAGDVRVDAIEQAALLVALTGSGSVVLSGKVDTLGLALSGSGDIDARHLLADGCHVELVGSGDVATRVGIRVEVNTTGSGDVIVAGNPSQREVRVRGSGDVFFEN